MSEIKPIPSTPFNLDIADEIDAVCIIMALENEIERIQASMKKAKTHQDRVFNLVAIKTLQSLLDVINAPVEEE